MSDDSLSVLFAALSDPTRRAILFRLRQGEASIGELSYPFELSAPAIKKHLKVLERSGLISRGRDEQWRPCRLEAKPFKSIGLWVEQYRQFWDDGLDRLDEHLKKMKAKGKKRAGKN